MHALHGLAEHVVEMVKHGIDNRSDLCACKRAYFLLLRYTSEDMSALRTIYDYLASRVYNMPAFGEPDNH